MMLNIYQFRLSLTRSNHISPILDGTNVGLIQSSTVETDIYLTSCLLWTIISYVRLSCITLKQNLLLFWPRGLGLYVLGHEDQTYDPKLIA